MAVFTVTRSPRLALLFPTWPEIIGLRERVLSVRFFRLSLHEQGLVAQTQPSVLEGCLVDSQAQLFTGASMATRVIFPESLIKYKQRAIAPSPHWLLFF